MLHTFDVWNDEQKLERKEEVDAQRCTAVSIWMLKETCTKALLFFKVVETQFKSADITQVLCVLKV